MRIFAADRPNVRIVRQLGIGREFPNLRPRVENL